MPIRTRAVLLCVLVVGGVFAWRYLPRTRARLVVTDVANPLPADGAEHRAFSVRRTDGRAVDAEDVSVTGVRGRAVASGGATFVEVQAPSVPGERRVRIQANGVAPVAVTVDFHADSADRFHDGTPEFVRLHTEADRKAFRGWFTALADAASTLPPEKLPREISDCAALLRWCYRNALHAHDEAWGQTMPFAVPPPLPSVTQYVWPETALGDRLFRVREGAFSATDATDGTFAQFADARTLMLRNTFLVSRNVAAALPGDLLFYRQLEQNSPFHSMIVTGTGEPWAVYHTGPIGRGPGEMRRVMLQDLLHHPDRQWRPNVDNENFLGVYRWNILRQDRR